MDNDGAIAIRAVVDGDLQKIHDLFRRFFEYLDAQKLRTPKGLDWIRAQYPNLDQLHLMLEMQHLRQMHCTMWMEAARQIVSAEESEIKFIITDHPVTIYHADCPPSSPQCAYPGDPDIALKGSQTLFPLGKDHCLILTNLEYAKIPSRGDLLQERANARHFGKTISRIDKWIRDKGKSWEDVRRELSDEQVARLHTAFASLWPKDTNLADLLPRPDGRIFRALYIGLIDPRTIAARVIKWIPYFDEIVVLNPFVNGACVRPEYSPIESPGQYKEETIKNVALLESLIPSVQAGIVHVIPDLLELNDTLRQMAWSGATERVGRVQLSPDDYSLAREFAKDDVRRAIGRWPDEALKRQIRISSPDIAEDEVERAVAHIRAEHARDPLALIQTASAGQDNGQLQHFREINFELAMFLAQLTGAALYTDQRATVNDLTAASTAGSSDEAGGTKQGMQIRIFVDSAPSVTMARRAAPAFRAFRSALLGVWNAGVAEQPKQRTVLPEALQAIATASQALMAETVEVLPEGTANAIFEIDATLRVPSHGYSLNASQRFVLAFGRRKHISTVPLALLFGRATGLAIDDGRAAQV